MLTPILLEEMDSMKSRLAVLSSDVEKPKMEDMDDLFALLEMLKMAIMTHDSEAADNNMKQIMSFAYEGDVQERLEHLNIHVMNLEDDEALADIEKLQN